MPSSSVAHGFRDTETLFCVQRMLDQMRDKYRAVFVLRHVDAWNCTDRLLA